MSTKYESHPFLDNSSEADKIYISRWRLGCVGYFDDFLGKVMGRQMSLDPNNEKLAVSALHI